MEAPGECNPSRASRTTRCDEHLSRASTRARDDLGGCTPGRHAIRVTHRSAFLPPLVAQFLGSSQRRRVPSVRGSTSMCSRERRNGGVDRGAMSRGALAPLGRNGGARPSNVSAMMVARDLFHQLLGRSGLLTAEPRPIPPRSTIATKLVVRALPSFRSPSERGDGRGFGRRRGTTARVKFRGVVALSSRRARCVYTTQSR